MMAVIQVENGCLVLHLYDGCYPGREWLSGTALVWWLLSRSRMVVWYCTGMIIRMQLLECDMINELSDDKVINAAASDDQDN